MLGPMLDQVKEGIRQITEEGKLPSQIDFNPSTDTPDIILSATIDHPAESETDEPTVQFNES